MRFAARFAAAACCACGMLAFAWWGAPSSPHAAPEPVAGSLVAALARLALPRTTAPRLSIDVAYRRCRSATHADDVIARTTCERDVADSAVRRRVLPLARQASLAVTSHVDPDAWHAAALVELLWPADTGKALTRSISFLRSAARLSDRPAPVLADLAAALLVRAEWTQDVRDVVEAVESSANALALDPRNASARFNLALALDRLGLDAQTASAWQRYLMTDSTSRWAAEARTRTRGAVRRDASPQAARTVVWDSVFGAWADATLAHDGARGATALAFADSVGAMLERRGGDATIADAVRAIRARATRPAALRTLARAHRAYAAGQQALAREDFVAAERAFRDAMHASHGSIDTPLHRWAAVAHVAALGQLDRTDLAERESRALVAAVDSVRHAALAARARWARGTVLLRSRRPEEALALYRAAARLFDRAGEAGNAGIVRYLEGDAQHVAGDFAAMHGTMRRAREALRAQPDSIWLHDLLTVWASATAVDFPRAAVFLQDEGIGVAVATRRPAFVAEARIARARLALDAGDTTRAADEIARARPLVDGLPAGAPRDWLRADLQLVDGTRVRRSAPRRAAAALDSAVRFFGDNRVRLFSALVARAEARFVAGRAAGAEADLARAVTLVERQHDATRSVPLRASTLDAAQRIVDRLAMRRVHAGRVADALAFVDRSRVSFAPPRSSTRRAAASRVVGLEIAFVGDTLLAWTVDDAGVRLTQSIVGRAALTRAIERVDAALALRAGDADARQDLATLYDRLIRPIEARLGADGTPVVVIADGEIAALPFAALYDRVRGRHLVEAHPLRFASRLRAARVTARGRRVVRRALLVGEPALDARQFPTLVRLPGAAAELAAIAPSYPSARVIAGADADREALVTGLADADIAHFAGHAVFDDDHPDRSYLAVAPSRASGTGGRVSAADIATLDLRRLRLVVLSACETARPRSGRSGGFVGLTGAFLAAGVGGVIGSLWSVDDASTGTLMADVHRAYQASGDGADALRQAQMRAIHSPDSARRSPGAWAAFRYVGG